jgi:carboxylate-amine ligase
MLAFVDDVADELGPRKEVEGLTRDPAERSGADRQLAVYEKTGGDLKQVVDCLRGDEPRPR